MSDKRKIIVTGHSYAYPYYFKVFEYVKNPRDFIFILPKVWKAKMTLKLKDKSGFNIYGARALSYGRNSFLGGPFKGWMPGLAYLLFYLRLKQRAGVLYSCSEPNLLTTLFNGLAAKLFGLKLILFTWQNIVPEARMRGLKLKLSNFLVKLNLRLADGIICGNKKAAEIVSGYRLPVADRILICPLSGVDIKRFKIEERNEWKNKNGLGNKKIILFYGALEKRKGVEFLLKAFALAQIPESFLVIIGTGPDKEKLTALARELKIFDSVRFFNWMPNEELPQILNSSEVFVYPSMPYGGWEEQFGYAMAEAGACGVPVVATRTGSINEVICHNKTGILIESGNSEELAIAINKLLSDDNLRKQMGEHARKYVVNNFSHQEIALKIENFLKNDWGK